jgi:hypothetical protein
MTIMDLHSLAEAVKPYIPPFFLTTLVTAAFGAFAGAWAANRIQTKRAVVTELNSVHAALVLCFSISNRYVSLKKQHVKGLHDRYIVAQQAHQRHVAAGGPRVFELHADLQTITPVTVPTEVLQRYVFEKISISGRALAAAVDLVGAIDGLNTAIKYRNDLVMEFQKASPIPPSILAERYLGLRNADGATDERVRANVEAIYNQTDDCIFFSQILANDVLVYGKKLRRRYAWQFRLRTPKFSGADWTEARQAGLIPSDKQYENWLKGFKKTRNYFRTCAQVALQTLRCGKMISESAQFQAKKNRHTIKHTGFFSFGHWTWSPQEVVRLKRSETRRSLSIVPGLRFAPPGLRAA